MQVSGFLGSVEGPTFFCRVNSAGRLSEHESWTIR